ncbi:hypothetical protein DR086_03370 [Mycoplasma hyopneumoniae]|nr:hypothetical protein [Mesomycoplasma hyopneumoniae]
MFILKKLEFDFFVVELMHQGLSQVLLGYKNFLPVDNQGQINFNLIEKIILELEKLILII